jgi:outer membrane protein assembly factor BamB
LDPKAGTELWKYPYITDFNCNIATPLAVGGGVLLSAGENHGSVLLSLKPNSEKFDVAEIWKSQGASSVLRNEWQTSVQVSGQLYGFDNVGSAGPVTHLTCITAATGSRLWQQQRFGKGNLIAADGKLFISTMQGELVVARVNPAKYEELGRKMVVGKTRQAPALSRGLLYLRDDREIICLDARNH